MNGLSELKIMPEESIEEYKVRCFNVFLEEASNIFPILKRYKFNVVYSNAVINEFDLSSYGSLVCISEQGVFYWFRPYSEPGALKIGSYKLNTIYDFINNPIKDLVVTDNAPYIMHKESDLDGDNKIIVDRLLELKKEKKEHMLNDMKRFLDGSKNYYDLYKALIDEDIIQIKRFLDVGTIQNVGIKKSEIEEYIDLIATSDHEETKSFRFSFIFRIISSASAEKGDNFNYDWYSDEYKVCSARLDDYMKEITPIAKNYFANLLDNFSKSEVVDSVNKIIFR